MAYFKRSELNLVGDYLGYDMKKQSLINGAELKRNIMKWVVHSLREDNAITSDQADAAEAYISLVTHASL